jgi:hypothetical protein
MCGILGFTRYVASPSQLIAATVMAQKMVERGRQSWGTTDGLTVAKDVGAITKHSLLDTHIGQRSSSPGGVLFAHTRASSHGSVSKENAHPHILVSDDASNMVIGVHNGTVASACMFKHNAKKFEVDTQLLFDLIVNDQPTDEIEGTGVLVYMVNNEALRFLRFNSTNLYIAQDLGTGGLMWASTKIAVEEAAELAGIKLGEEIKTQPETIYELREGEGTIGHVLVEIGKKKFSTLTATTYTDATGAQQFHRRQNHHQGVWGVGSGYHQGSGTVHHYKCKVCDALRPEQTEVGVCPLCLAIAEQPDNSTNYGNFLWFGHHELVAPSDQTHNPPTQLPVQQELTDSFDNYINETETNIDTVLNGGEVGALVVGAKIIQLPWQYAYDGD